MEICRRLYECGDGELPESLRQICADRGMPGLAVVCGWLVEEAGFAERYGWAMELRKEALVDRLLELAGEARASVCDSVSLQAVKLEIETLKWVIAKEYAREYVGQRGSACGGSAADAGQGDGLPSSSRRPRARRPVSPPEVASPRPRAR